MRISITMKDPDTLYDSIREAVTDELNNAPPMDDDEREAVAELREEKARTICNQWFKYGEYLTVVVDTEAKTCTVRPASD